MSILFTMAISSVEYFDIDLRNNLFQMIEQSGLRLRKLNRIFYFWNNWILQILSVLITIHGTVKLDSEIY